jgi:hypothetical protein
MAGVEWLVARGQVHLVEATGDVLRLAAGDGHACPEARRIQDQIKTLLEETAAFRHFFLRARGDRCNALLDYAGSRK